MSLRRDIKRKKIDKDFLRTFRRKIQSLRFPQLEQYKYLVGENSQELDFLEDVNGVDLLKRTEEISYDLSDLEEILFYDGDWIEGYRNDYMMRFRNPIPGNPKRPLETWAGVYLKDYDKHLEKTRINASKYCVDRKIEFEVFKRGIGYLESSKRLIMFGNFEGEIGESEKKKTSIVKLQVDREAIPRSYRTGIHGFPITREKLYQDFKGAKRVLENVIEVPESFR
tara:strand:+ start:18 stop:692 length:675 start_codon:yes stop_codon:yes gene_type:complete